MHSVQATCLEIDSEVQGPRSSGSAVRSVISDKDLLRVVYNFSGSLQPIKCRRLGVDDGWLR